MHASNKLISGLWICPDDRGVLSNLERLCIHSFVANGHDFRLYVYGDIANLPQVESGGKVEVADANEILSAANIFQSHDSYALFADWFRWELMRQQGGWYVDMDMICLQPFDFADDVVMAREGQRKITNAVLKFPRDHVLAKGMLESCMHPNRMMPWDDAMRRRSKWKKRLRFWRDPHKIMNWGEIGGPAGLTHAATHFDLAHLAQPQHIFMPIFFRELNYLLDDTLHNIERLEPMLKHSYAIHFFNAMWQWRQWNKNDVFSEHSVFEVLKRRYLPECMPR